MPDRTGPRGPTLDLKSLEVFLAIMESGSITRAAQSLGMTQSAASQILSRLEAGLGSNLFDRVSRPLRPTRAGEILQQRARILMGEAERTVALVREADSSVIPIIRAGLVDSFATTVGPHLVKGLRGHADQLRIWSGIAPNLSQDLLNRSLDLVIGSDPMEDLVGLERHRLFVEPLVLVMPKNQAKSWSQLLLSDLAASVPMVRYSIRSGLGSQIDRHLRRMKIEVPPALEFDATEAVFAMVGAGIGWAITTPLCLLQGRSFIPELSIRPLPGPAVARSLYLVLRGGELTVLAERIADISCKTLKSLTKKELMPLAPWLSKHIRVGEGKTE